ncbi:hypothetical protein X777_06348 [Ooceraea biroi]|uniref:Uncharacterized protein n=1 Tax=Ooceraea biroi TaxID=2015173 RepID=A0A026WE12_OOCBI|nr:hypothetical protein X777_06348 [Ooceraea biroi]
MLTIVALLLCEKSASIATHVLKLCRNGSWPLYPAYPHYTGVYKLTGELALHVM